MSSSSYSFVLSGIVVALVTGSMVADGVTISASTDRELFESFKVEFGRRYETEDEEAKRFVVFQTNMRSAEELNKISASDPKSSAVFGPTKFSDLTATEFASQYLNYVSTTSDTKSVRVATRNSSIPSKIDWSGNLTTPVKDQGQCGSCWAFSATEQIESIAIKDGILTPNKPLAVQQIVSCDRGVDEGCNGGDTTTAYKYVQRAGGLESEEVYPYKSGRSGRTGRCEQPESKDLLVNVVSSRVVGKNDEEEMAQLVAEAPLSICVDAERWQNYRHGVLTNAICKAKLDHCVQLTGYDFTMREEKEKIWWVRNSWNTDWGVKGFIALAYGEDTCGISKEPTTVTVKAV